MCIPCVLLIVNCLYSKGSSLTSLHAPSAKCEPCQAVACDEVSSDLRTSNFVKPNPTPPLPLKHHNHTSTMAATIARSLRLAEPSICRQCATLQSRRTFASLFQNPKREIRSRTATQALKTSTPSQTASPWATLSRRGYKTVQEAKSRARSGVRSSLPFAPHPSHTTAPQANTFPSHSPSPGKQASSSSPPASA